MKEEKVEAQPQLYGTSYLFAKITLTGQFLATVHLPALYNLVKEAFSDLNKAPASAIRTAKKAWNELRKYLLKLTVGIFQLSEGEWTYRTVSWLLMPEENVVRKMVEDRIVPWQALPQDFRAQLIQRGSIAPIDVVKVRDSEFGMLAV